MRSRIRRSVAVGLVVLASCGPAAREGDAEAEPPEQDFTIARTVFRSQHVTELDGPPMAVTFRGGSDGFIAIGSGEIEYFTIAEDGVITRRRVADGLWQPRGIAYHNGELFVTDVQFPCERMPGFDLVRCARSEQFPGVPKEEVEAHIIRESRGRILAFTVDADGSLGSRRVLVDKLPSASSDHSVNGIAVGPEGDLYVAIGGFDILFRDPEIAEGTGRAHLDLLGTIVRVPPDGSGLHVFARGVRNIYGLVFDEHGRLYGIDNDGPTAAGPRHEEILRLEEGAHYGYPFEGSQGPFEVRDGLPLGALDAVGSAGLEWAPRLGLPPGLLVGSCGKFSAVFIEEDQAQPRLDQRLVTTMSSCTTVVKAIPDGRILLGGLRPHQLIVFRPV